MGIDSKFATALEQFALSVDIVDSDAMERIGEALGAFFRQQLSVNYYDISIRKEMRPGVPGLSSRWTSGKEQSWPIYENKVYSGHSAYAFDKDQPLWITANGGDQLKDANQYLDSWSHAQDLPPFWNYAKNIGIRTSVIVPMRTQRDLMGVVVLEFAEHIPATKRAREELQSVADSIAEIFSLHEANSQQRRNTAAALGNLATTAREERCVHLGVPKVFLAFPKDSDDTVVGLLKEVLKDPKKKLKVIAWDEKFESGNIPTQLANDIRDCHFGVCYFSQKKDDAFIDNPNVIFEAGMFRGRDDSGQPGCYPVLTVREDCSPPAPFDFARDRMLVIKRDPDGKINKQQVRAEIEESIKPWLQDTE